VGGVLLRSIDPGKLRERVTIQQAVETRNELGESQQAWGTWKTVWASVEGLSSREALFSGQQQTDITHRVRMRYVDGLSQNMRLLWRDRVLEIVSLLEHNNRSEHEMVCTEEVVHT
jgi:SPP1 family predicted phage head-tail adaptor